MNFLKGCHLAAITIIATCCLITEATYAANPCEIGAAVKPSETKIANGKKKVEGKCVIVTTKIDYSESNGVTITCDNPDMFISNGKECVIKRIAQCTDGQTQSRSCDKLPKYATVGTEIATCKNGNWVESGKCQISQCSGQRVVKDNICIGLECTINSKPEETDKGCPAQQPGWTKSVKTRKVCTDGLWEAWSECSTSTALCSSGQVWDAKAKKCQASTCTPKAQVSNIACIDGKDKMPAGALTAEKSGVCNALGTEVEKLSDCVPKECKPGFRFNAKNQCIKDDCTVDDVVEKPVMEKVFGVNTAVGTTKHTKKCVNGQYAKEVSETVCTHSGFVPNSKNNGCVMNSCGLLTEDRDPISISIKGVKGKQHVGDLVTTFKCVAGKKVVDSVTAECSVAGFTAKGKTCVPVK